MKLWIAKNKRGKLGLYPFKPHYDFTYDLWICKLGNLSIKKKDFPEVTFENSPQMVEIKLIKEE